MDSKMITQQNHVFIDPEQCGSSVGYFLQIGENEYKEKVTYYVSGSVVLADCSHKIDWSFGDDNLDKIDAAIRMLQEFRKKYIEMQKHVNQLNKK